jgi:hypothetical protein
MLTDRWYLEARASLILKLNTMLVTRLPLIDSRCLKEVVEQAER